MKMAFRNIDGLVAEVACKEELPLLNEPIMAGFLSLEQFLIHVPCLFRRYNAFIILLSLATA